MTEVRLEHIADKNYVDVEKSVGKAKIAFETNNSIILVARQSEIARAGIVIKTLEEGVKCKVTKF
jgi:hypothetical protein